jgi:hypothetical protein
MMWKRERFLALSEVGKGKLILCLTDMVSSVIEVCPILFADGQLRISSRS